MTTSDDKPLASGMRRAGTLPPPVPVPSAERAALAAVPAAAPPPAAPVEPPDKADPPPDPVAPAAPHDAAAGDQLGRLRDLLGVFAGAAKEGVNLDLPKPVWDTARRYADGLGVPYRVVVIDALVQYLEQQQVPVQEGYRSRARF